jgi:hypothetical protein
VLLPDAVVDALFSFCSLISAELCSLSCVLDVVLIDLHPQADGVATAVLSADFLFSV